MIESIVIAVIFGFCILVMLYMLYGFSIAAYRDSRSGYVEQHPDQSHV